MPYEPNTYSLAVGALDKATGLCSLVLSFPAQPAPECEALEKALPHSQLPWCFKAINSVSM